MGNVYLQLGIWFQGDFSDHNTNIFQNSTRFNTILGTRKIKNNSDIFVGRIHFIFWKFFQDRFLKMLISFSSYFWHKQLKYWHSKRVCLRYTNLVSLIYMFSIGSVSNARCRTEISSVSTVCQSTLPLHRAYNPRLGAASAGKSPCRLCSANGAAYIFNIQSHTTLWI